MPEALAAAVRVPAEPNEQGETVDEKGVPLTRPAVLSDKIPPPYPNENAARANNGGALPPDLSLMAKARVGGASYIYSLLTGYKVPAEFVFADSLPTSPIGKILRKDLRAREAAPAV